MRPKAKGPGDQHLPWPLGGAGPRFTMHTKLALGDSNSPTFCLAARKRAGSLTLSASRKAPSSRTSSSMVAVCTCSVAFISFQDSSASGRSKLSTVSTTACTGGRTAPSHPLNATPSPSAGASGPRGVSPWRLTLM